MTRKLFAVLVGCGIASNAEPAFASGDMSVLLIPTGQVTLTMAFLLWLWMKPTRDQKLILAICFFAALTAIDIATVHTPYPENRWWLLPALLITPVFGWILGVAITRRGKVR